jgi:hypothetical protein
MKLSQKIIAEISQTTREIEEKYPELQKYLTELPITLLYNENMVDDKALNEYLENLKSIVKNYKSEH